MCVFSLLLHLSYEFFNDFDIQISIIIIVITNKFGIWSLAKMHIIKVIAIFEWAPIRIFWLARTLAAHCG